MTLGIIYFLDKRFKMQAFLKSPAQLERQKIVLQNNALCVCVCRTVSDCVCVHYHMCKSVQISVVPTAYLLADFKC